ncbi:MAG: ribonuclease H-like domain-containing protein [Chloroflexota bacterium]
MRKTTEAYLDIETTGLSWWRHHITVIGAYLVDGDTSRVTQLVGEEVSAYTLLQVLDGVQAIYTYNGSRFDLPFIYARLGVDLITQFHHQDLMYDCWRSNLKGGLKAVERTLRIPRELPDLDGRDAVLLWRRYQERGDLHSLWLLLKYNREDITNLKVLREKLWALRRVRRA